MGTSSKGRSSFVSPWRQNQRSANGAFGQSHYEKICNNNKRTRIADAIRAMLAVDKDIKKDERQKLERQLKELTR